MSIELQNAFASQLADIRATADSLGQVAAGVVTPGSASAGATGGFASHLGNALQAVNEQDRAAGEKMAEVDSGRSGDLVGAMLASQEASLSFSMLMQVRNKVMGAVDELIKLPL